ncbi:hypothetical protein GCM10010319_54170 [Streptomyces blastmyceticus]|uniref:Uncharacterized protein n=1 Tax=Streptomyces blastmyceticus TaxID=68180 RepID=A0ABP3HGF5_9ACTN
MALVQHLRAAQARGLGEVEPLGVTAVPVVGAVLIEDPLHPAAAHLGVRAVGDDGSVLLRQALLVIPAVGDPLPQLLAAQLTAVQAQVQRVFVPVAVGVGAQRGREFLRAPGGGHHHRPA